METCRERVIARLNSAMIQCFTDSHLADAQNLDAFITSLEAMSDEEYDMLVNEEVPGAIS